MKLNYKKTFLIGLAFMSICAFWQLYDGLIPMILKYTFKISDTISGVIMALDNVIALFLLPILSGFLLEHVGYWTLFPYGALFVALSFVTMIFVRHGDSRPDAKQAAMEAIAASDD